jgi:ribonuclease Z
MKLLIRCLTLITALLVFSPAVAQDIEVTLLGTGTPEPTLDRFGAATLVKAGDNLILIDAGRGVLQRLNQLNVPYDEIDALFLTHLHSDHIVGLPDLWLTGWLLSRRNHPLQVFGPAGTTNLIENLREAFSFDIDIRISDDHSSEAGSILQVTEVEDGYIYENGGVRVVAFGVDHSPVSPALGYRVEYGERKVIISGDTKYSENLIENSMGVDLLIHEVAGASEAMLTTSQGVQRAFAHHTTAQQAGRIFTITEPKLAAYSHVVMFGVDEAYLLSETRLTYDGPLVLGQDLMRFVVGDEVEVIAP